MPTALTTTLGRDSGSAASRRLVANDQIPGIVYGHGMEPVKVAVARRDLRDALSGPAGQNTILELRVGDATYPAIVKEIQRDPVHRVVRHVDFMQISLTEVITVPVPLHLKGVAKAVVAEGGIVDPVVNTVNLRATATNIPNEIVVDVSEMGMDDVVRLGELPLPEGVVAVGDPDLVVITVLTTKIEEVVAPAAAATPAEGDAAAPPAEGAAPAADAKPAE
jgi:large subunit ribosomal protein L25